jgi:hypothetical protein
MQEPNRANCAFADVGDGVLVVVDEPALATPGVDDPPQAANSTATLTSANQIVATCRRQRGLVFRSRVTGNHHSVGERDEGCSQHNEYPGLDSLENPESVGWLEYQVAPIGGRKQPGASWQRIRAYRSRF